MDDDKSGFVPSAVNDSAGWRELPMIKYMCDKKCKDECFKLDDLAAVVVEEDGKPHTINLCRNCYDCRLTEVAIKTNAVWKDLIRHKTSRGRLWTAFASDGFSQTAWELLPEEATQTMQLDTASWPIESPY